MRKIFIHRELGAKIEAMEFNRDTFNELVEFTDGKVRDISIERRIGGNCTCIFEMEPNHEVRIKEGTYIIRLQEGLNTGKFTFMEESQFHAACKELTVDSDATDFYFPTAEEMRSVVDEKLDTLVVSQLKDVMKALNEMKVREHNPYSCVYEKHLCEKTIACLRSKGYKVTYHPNQRGGDSHYSIEF